MKEGNLFRYRCRVGHAYTAETLNIAFTNSVEDTLWASMRALEEKADLLRRMATRADQRSAARYEEEAARVENHAAVIRDMLAESGDTVAEESPDVRDDKSIS